MATFNVPPEPNYEREVNRLIRYYRTAALAISAKLAGADISDTSASMQRKLLAQIETILTELDENALEWINENLPRAYDEGRAAALVSIGEATTISAGLEALTLGDRLNRHFVEAFINDTYGDLLQATQNTRRRVKQVIREVVAEQLRSKAAQNQGRRTMTGAITDELRKKLTDAGQFAIKDRANRNWKIEDYASVVVRTKIQQAHVEAVRNEAVSRGAMYGVISSHGATDACRFHEGRIIKLTADASGNYPTYESLRATNQIFHPNCKHTVHALRDVNLLPQSLRDKAERQAEIGTKAVATGKRNPVL